jgi:arginine decarboxylase
VGQGLLLHLEDGHVLVHPTKDPARAIDLKQLDRSPAAPRHRPAGAASASATSSATASGDIANAFKAAINQHSYEGRYVCVYPIKVNQQRQVVEEVLDFGRELRASASRRARSPSCWPSWRRRYNDTPIICNGFKDAEYIEMAMLAQKIGRNIIPVVEKYTELGLILKYAETVGVRPQIGMRVKLAARGSGRWQGSGGYRSSSASPSPSAARARGAEAHDMQDCFKLLHFHLGSQIPNIRIVKGALNEAARHLHRAGEGGAGPRVPRRRRRLGRRLRRLADQLRVERQLHARGISQRRRLPHPDGVRRRGGQASDDRVRERPRHRRLSQRA